jgi:hypothetical protein
MISTTFVGRTGNILLQNIGTSIISKKYDLFVDRYEDGDNLQQFGVILNQGKRQNINFKIVSDDGNIYRDHRIQEKCISLMELMSMESVDFGIKYEGYFQVGEFINIHKEDIKNHFRLNYTERDKDEVFVHVRLGDVDYRNPGLDYYRKALRNISPRGGYISSDSPSHHIVGELCKEFNLIIFDGDPLSTIDFGKDFVNIVLSQGTFSWWIGFLSRSKNIYWPKGGDKWHGDIFVFDEWNHLEF